MTDDHCVCREFWATHLADRTIAESFYFEGTVHRFDGPCYEASLPEARSAKVLICD
jgi:hypothetical protein